MSIKHFVKNNHVLYATWCTLKGQDTFAANVFAPHLGGYIPGGYWKTHSPALYEFFLRERGCRTAFDVGCAEGQSLEAMIGMGYEDARGIDGFAKVLKTSKCPERISIHDLTKCPYLAPKRADFVWCCEVAEHIEEKYVGNLVLTLAGNCARYLALTHALPGQPGYHHVNCRPPEYWIGLVEGAGLRFEPDLTTAMRELMQRTTPGSFFAKTGLVFSRP